MSGVPRIGIVGAGWWSATHHIPSLLAYPDAELVALADVDAERLHTVADHFGITARFGSAEELYAGGQVDGVVIATPHHQHYAPARAALEAGLHVLVEKPLTLCGSEAWKLVQVAKAAGVHLMVGYPHQTTTIARHARNVVHSGGLGDLVLMTGLSASRRSWLLAREQRRPTGSDVLPTGPGSARDLRPSAGGGQGFSQATHGLSMAFYVTGLQASQVYAHMTTGGGPVDIADAITLQLHDAGPMTMASTGTITPPHPNQHELRYYGTQGFMLQDLLRGTLDVYHNDGGAEHLQLTEEEIAPLDAPARRFVDLIAGSGENPGPGAVAARAVDAIEAAYRSVSLGLPVAIERK